MSKKLDIDNPAMNFITQNEEAQGQSNHEEAKPGNPPAGYKLDPKYIEVRSKRVQLVIQPSLYEEIKKAARKDKVSVNEYCHRVLSAAVGKE